MHAKTIWVFTGLVVCLGSTFVAVRAEGEQVEKVQKATLRYRSDVATSSNGQPTGTRLRTIKGSSGVTTVRQHANSIPTSSASVSGGTASAETAVIPTNQPIRSLGSNTSIMPLQSASVAGNPGTTIYFNDISPNISGIYTPGAGQRMADDAILAGGGCAIVYYNIAVGGFTDSGGIPLAPFDVTTALWDGDPCNVGSTMIAGSEATTTDVPSDGQGYILDVNLPAPVVSTDTVWISAVFSTDDSGWFLGEQAQIGSTGDVFSEDNTDTQPPNSVGCFQFSLNNYHSGFYATINCNLDVEPTGACCDGDSCSILTEAECPLGNWKGAFSACDPSPCLAGACCSGETFGDCLDVTESQCTDGIFKPGELCSSNACTPTHQVYANTLDTFTFTGVGTDEIMADDVRFSRDTPCEMVAYEMLVAGVRGSGPAEFNAELGVWTNKTDPNHPGEEIWDTPNQLIPGSDATFLNIPANGASHRLLVTVPPGIILTDKVWVAMTTNTPRLDPNAGPLVGGPGKYNDSSDAFSLYNSPVFGANVWQPGIFLGGYDPNFECDPNPDDGIPPPPGLCPAGNIRMRIYCDGDRPTGACCDDKTAGCTDGVRSFECDGRFLPDTTCAQNLFNPPCGTGQCCAPNPFNPNALICSENLPSECAAAGGSHDPTKTCLDACPSFRSCVGSPSSCFTARRPGSQETGCNETPCCVKVCTSDDFCCTTEWDEGCAATATDICDVSPVNDNWHDATPIVGEGTYEYDNTLATLDGPSNEDCTELGDIDTITNDVWFCWEATCTDTVFFKTCEETVSSTVDTKIAVYGDCATPPNDLSLKECNDDTCLIQSQVSFNATAGESYLLRVGTFPGREGDVGSIELQCGAPPHSNCPGTGDCCDEAGTGSPGCSEESCCRRVCAEDAFCCNVEWDSACATTGFNGNGAGAAVICTDVCGGCPAGSVQWVDPLNGTVDAGIPHDLDNAANALGIDAIHVNAPLGAGGMECWSLCETSDGGSPNSIANIIDNGAGAYTIQLTRPITTDAVTTINYTGDGVPGVFTAHPGNVNGDGVSSAADVLALINVLDGDPAAWGAYSSDINRSGESTPIDLLTLIDVLNGSKTLDSWLNTTKPIQTGCP